MSVKNQKIHPNEIIITDDGSSDKTIEIVEAFFDEWKEIENQLIKNKHKGAGANRNSGIKVSKYAWISFLDSDDRWFDTKIKEVVKGINNNPDVNFIFHNEQRKLISGEVTLLHDFASFFNKEEPLIKQLWRYCIFHTSAITVKKDLLLKVGLFNETLLSSQDWDLWLKLAPYIDYLHINKTLGIYVDRKNNITNTKSLGGLIDRLRVMSIHWSISEVSIWEYIYMSGRRIIGFLISFFRTNK
jgi:glycosyltransferase involved in cell wall biosynthesis